MKCSKAQFKAYWYQSKSTSECFEAETAIRTVSRTGDTGVGFVSFKIAVSSPASGSLEIVCICMSFRKKFVCFSMSLTISSPSASRKRKLFDDTHETPSRRIRWLLRKESPLSPVFRDREDTVSQNLKDVLNGLEKAQLQNIILQLVENNEALQNQVSALLPRPVISGITPDLSKRLTDTSIARKKYIRFLSFQ